MANRLREIRKTQGRTLKDVASQAGMTHVQLSRLEKGQRQLKQHQLLGLSQALNVSPEMLLDRREVPLLGTVGPGSVVHVGFRSTGKDVVKSVPALSSLPQASLAALEVQGDFLAPLVTDRGIIYFLRFFEHTSSENFDHLLGRLAIVRTRSGLAYLGRLRRAPSSGCYNLELGDAPTLEDIDVCWALRVIGTAPREAMYFEKIIELHRQHQGAIDKLEGLVAGLLRLVQKSGPPGLKAKLETAAKQIQSARDSDFDEMVPWDGMNRALLELAAEMKLLASKPLKSRAPKSKLK